MKSFILATLAVVVAFSASLSLNAQEKGGKKDPVATMVAQIIKQLEKAELTADQTTKIKEIYTKAAKEVSTKRTEAGITDEMLKKQVEAFKAAKESGKKMKNDEVIASMGMKAEQTKIFTETQAILTKAKIEIGKLLSPEQIAKLPEAAQNAFKERAAGKGKKKKE